jgi:hypothetical protein
MLIRRRQKNFINPFLFSSQSMDLPTAISGTRLPQLTSWIIICYVSYLHIWSMYNIYRYVVWLFVNCTDACILKLKYSLIIAIKYMYITVHDCCFCINDSCFDEQFLFWIIMHIYTIMNTCFYNSLIYLYVHSNWVLLFQFTLNTLFFLVSLTLHSILTMNIFQQ